MSLKICSIIIANGRLGETHFVQKQIDTNLHIRNIALNAVLLDEIGEWYRIQYNIPLKKFYKMKLKEELIYEDFYRRQYYEEIRLNLRKFDDRDIEFKMPPFSMFRPYGGAMPVPNGFGVDTEYSYDLYRARNEASSSDNNQVIRNEDGSYTIEDFRGPGRPGVVHDTQTAEYESDYDEFADMLSRTDDDTMWEELERITPGER